MEPIIQTRFLIVSDTHGKEFINEGGLPDCDVAIHCGDLTDGSKLEEFRTTLEQMKLIKAPLKLVIAGNHDFTMDTPAFERKVADAAQPLVPELVAQEYGVPGRARELFEEAKDAGIVFLDEGTYHFNLANGAQLNVYASPYTPSMGQWGFQYHPNKGHEFAIDQGIDIAITHGPPKGIMDYTYGRERAGCPDLFSAIVNARPRLHCFGHIHEGWGARLVTWKDDIEQPTHFTAIDNHRSPIIEKLADLREGRYDSEEDAMVKRRKLEALSKDKCSKTSHCSGDEHALHYGKQTLFVNAAVETNEDFEQRPWLIDLELPRRTSSERANEEREGEPKIKSSLNKQKANKTQDRVHKSNTKIVESERRRRWTQIGEKLKDYMYGGLGDEAKR